MKFSTLLTITFFIQIFAFSQTPTHTAPTLQVGLDGLAFGKGSVDSELILQMISEKQGEIKLRVAQNILLQPLNLCGATIYGFGDNILRAVIEEKDPIIRKRKILESTVNTIFTVAFSSYYLNRIKTSTSQTYTDQFQALKLLASIISNNQAEQNKLLEAQTTSKPGTDKEKKQSDNTLQLTFYTTILDIAAEAIRENKSLTNLGILNISYSKTFDYQSNFLNFPVKDITSTPDFLASTALIHQGMKEELSYLIQLIGVSKFLMNEKNFRTIAEKIQYDNFSTTGTLPTIQTIKNKLKNSSTASLNKNQSIEINKMYTYLDKIDHSNLSKSEYSDIVYTISNDFIPKLENLGVSNITIFELMTEMRVVSKILTNKILEDSKLKSTLEILSKDENIKFFTNLLSRLYELDKGSTYTEYFNLISEISKFLEQSPDFRNSKVKESISYFNTFVKDYVIISESEEGRDFIDFNVESFLSHLSEMKANKPQRISFLFDVGVSTGYFVKNPFNLTPDKSLQSISFVAEKIGVRWKFIDQGFWRRKSPGETYKYYGKKLKLTPPKEPVINNVFISLYGSGLLYNIFDVSTENEFNSPFLGTALGIGFFNNLDLSISAAVPVISDQAFSKSFEYPMVSINFDIRFNEYIQRLGEKRNAAQTQKALAKAESGK